MVHGACQGSYGSPFMHTGYGVGGGTEHLIDPDGIYDVLDDMADSAIRPRAQLFVVSELMANIVYEPIQEVKPPELFSYKSRCYSIALCCCLGGIGGSLHILRSDLFNLLLSSN